MLRGLGRNVIVLGLVSLLTDISHEMLYPVVPLFLTTVLGAPMTVVGLIEGIAESTASLLKVASGWLSDRWRRRQPFLVAGYSLSALSKPLLALATSWHVVLVSRLLDRLGKGIRTGARDGLIAASCDPAHRGKAFGLHRAMDTVGAFFGPLIALLLLSQFHTPYRTVFLLAFVPAVAGVAALSLVRDDPAPFEPEAQDRDQPRGRTLLPAGLWRLVFIFAVFAVGNSSDVFLLLRAKAVFLSRRPQDPQFAQTLMLMSYVLYNLVHALAAGPAGWLSDRLGRRRLIVSGFAVFAAVYLGFALSPGPPMVWALFALYGFYGAATEGVAKAQVADLSPPETRATAMGLLHTVTGLMAFAASVVAGLLWTRFGSSAPFVYGACCAGLAAALFLVVGPRPAPSGACMSDPSAARGGAPGAQSSSPRRRHPTSRAATT